MAAEAPEACLTKRPAPSAEEGPPREQAEVPAGSVGIGQSAQVAELKAKLELLAVTVDKHNSGSMRFAPDHLGEVSGSRPSPA